MGRRRSCDYVRWTNVASLADVEVDPWSTSRSERVRAGYRAGAVMPPIHVVIPKYGRRWLADGNHRLAVARELGVRRLLVRHQYDDSACLQRRARRD